MPLTLPVDSEGPELMPITKPHTVRAWIVMRGKIILKKNKKILCLIGSKVLPLSDRIVPSKCTTMVVGIFKICMRVLWMLNSRYVLLTGCWPHFSSWEDLASFKKKTSITDWMEFCLRPLKGVLRYLSSCSWNPQCLSITTHKEPPNIWKRNIKTSKFWDTPTLQSQSFGVITKNYV